MTTILRPEQIRTASLYPLATLEERTAGTGRILVTRYWLRGLKRSRIDAWWLLAAPDRIALQAYKVGRWDWETFAQHYDGHLNWYGADMRSEVSQLLDQYGTLTLLCHEHDAPEVTVRCHRRLLREMLLDQDGGYA